MRLVFKNRSSVSVWILLAIVMPAIGRAAESEKWAKAIDAFEQQDRETPPCQGGLLFVGSSSIRMWDLKKSFPDRLALNRGFGGSQMSDVIQYVDRIVIPYAPKIIVLYEGDNDIAAGKSADQVTHDFQSLVGLVHAELPKTKIVFISIKPSPKRWEHYPHMKQANDQIQSLTEKDDRLDFVDVSRVMIGDDGLPIQSLFVKDGLHLNAEGYRRWANLVYPHLSR